MIKASKQDTAAARPEEGRTITVPATGDIEESLRDLDSISSLLLGVAASIAAGVMPTEKSIRFLGASVHDRVCLLTDDLGLQVALRDGEG